MIDAGRWLQEAKAQAAAGNCGMYLIHNGVVRSTSRAFVNGEAPFQEVKAMDVTYDHELLHQIVKEAEQDPGICIVKVHINEGTLQAGDDIMYVLVGGDTRFHVLPCMDRLLARIKQECIREKEL